MQQGDTGWLTEAVIAGMLHETPATPSLDPWSPRYEQLRPAAVLVPLFREDNRWQLLLTRRTEQVNSHKGQVSFPGGGADAQDESAEQTALREAYEEIGLQPRDVHVLGRLVNRPTISSYMVTPVVARIDWPFPLRLSPGEVVRVFSIPLDWLADPANREDRAVSTPGGTYRNVIFFQPYDGEVLWGASARITIDLLEALKLA